MKIRIGQGIDVHQFAAGRNLVLGGVTIPHTRGLLGHSDADVVLHAITDALLGAAGKPDIGQRFKNSDQRWAGAASSLFVRDVMTELTAEGWAVSNVDCSILCEAPKIGPHVAAMKRIIAGLLEIAESDVGIKATTTEQLGFVGREEGIAAFAVVLLTRSSDQ